MVIKSLIWAIVGRVDQSNGRWPGVLWIPSPVHMALSVAVQKSILLSGFGFVFFFFTKVFQKISCSKQLLIVP